MLSGKTALVTGAGSGIGRSIAEELAKQKAHVLAADIDSAAAEKTAADINGRALEIDIGDTESIRKAAEAAGDIDILVNNAGISYTADLFDLTPAMWDRVMNINCRGTFFLSQAVFGGMLKRGTGRIINIASISGDRPAKFSDAAYCASKAGILMLTKVFAKRAAGTEITVNAVSPGIIDTPLTRKLGSTVTADEVPLGRMGSTNEVARVVAFLASDAASYISGQNLRVNGGQYMG